MCDVNRLRGVNRSSRQGDSDAHRQIPYCHRCRRPPEHGRARLSPLPGTMSAVAHAAAARPDLAVGPVWPLWPKRSCCEPWPDVPRDVFSRSCQLSLDRSVWHSQKFGCLTDRETVHHTQLKCSSQRGGQQCCASAQTRFQFGISTLVFWAGPTVRKCFPHIVRLYLFDRIIHG